ncbi:MAG TPA: glycosyltransferase N-terminal domain-containing protein [Candidatus Eisenbacteria bacterium]
MSLAWRAYRIAAPAIGALAPAAGLFSPSDERPVWGERLGRVRVEGACEAWIHAASLGEATAVGPLARELDSLRPGAALHLSATTVTGRARLAALAQKREAPTSVSLAPLDAPQAVRRFIAGVRPARVLLVETELWPHWLLAAREARVAVAVVSARLSERSVVGYRRLGRAFASLVAGLGAVLCQAAADRERWLAIGVRPEHTLVTGNLKHDALPAPAGDRAAARGALGLDPARPLLVLGSLRPGEVALLARAWRALPAALRSAWQVAAVPRHPRASDELAREAVDAGLTLVRGEVPVEGAWAWDARAGVLLSYYAAADAAFVGGSLGPYGGHNPLEPAACGAAVLMGPHHAAQADGVRALRTRDAVWIASSTQDLALGLRTLLGDPAARAARTAAGLEVVEGLRGVAARTVAELARLGLWPPR